MAQAALKKRVLIVDDDGDIRDTLAEALEMDGYEVISAANGEEALDQLVKFPKPDLILLDLEMPYMNGFGFSEEKDSDPTLHDIPVVIVSCHREERDIWERIRPKEYLRKPIELGHLLNTVRKHCS